MDKLTMNQLTSDISRNLLTQIAPQELPLFRATSKVYFEKPDKILIPTGEKDDMLGFGAGEAVTLLTPFVLVITTEIINFLVEEVKKAVKDESASLVNEKVKALFKEFRHENKDDNKIPPLSAEQLAQVQEIALKEARRLKLSEKNAKLLAHAIVGSLAVAS